MQNRYYQGLLRSALLGRLKKQGKVEQVEEIYDETSLLKVADNEGIKTHYFKRSNVLPRAQKVMGFLRSISFDSLLDVGSGRGAFLFPLLDAFCGVSVTSIDILDERVEFLQDIALGGGYDFNVEKANLCAYSPNKTFDVVTLLEVLEHIPDVKTAIRNAVNLSNEYIVVTVPSKADDNPEHIHLLTKEKLTNYFNECGVKSLSFDGVQGHLFMIARK
ncbi:MAG: class I SAM-dependent methyltransferase [Clostridia bacterium]|nr:class I SAM-dependent methyltransferase [Clostridia bacterium]